MNRVQVPFRDGRAGWFDLDAATDKITEPTIVERDGNSNLVGKISRLRTARANLYRTAKGRWVGHADSRFEFNGPDSWQWLTDVQARDWLIKCDSEEGNRALQQWFPETPEENGPDQGGRPAIGPEVKTRIPEDAIAKAEALAERYGWSRAQTLRHLILTGLDAVDAS